MKKILIVTMSLFALQAFAEKPVGPLSRAPSKKEAAKKEKALQKPGMTGEKLEAAGKKKDKDEKKDDKN